MENMKTERIYKCISLNSNMNTQINLWFVLQVHRTYLHLQEAKRKREGGGNKIKDKMFK